MKQNKCQLRLIITIKCHLYIRGIQICNTLCSVFRDAFTQASYSLSLDFVNVFSFYPHRPILPLEHLLPRSHVSSCDQNSSVALIPFQVFLNPSVCNASFFVSFSCHNIFLFIYIILFQKASIFTFTLLIHFHVSGPHNKAQQA